MIKKHSFVKEIFKLTFFVIMMFLDAIYAYFMWYDAHSLVKILSAVFFTTGALCFVYLSYNQFTSIVRNYKTIKSLTDKIN